MQQAKSVFTETATTVGGWAFVLTVCISLYEGLFWVASELVHLLGFTATTWKNYAALAIIYFVFMSVAGFFYHRNRLKKDQARRELVTAVRTAARPETAGLTIGAAQLDRRVKNNLIPF